MERMRSCLFMTWFNNVNFLWTIFSDLFILYVEIMNLATCFSTNQVLIASERNLKIIDCIEYIKTKTCYLTEHFGWKLLVY